MLLNNRMFVFFGCLSIQLLSVKMCQASECIPDLVYMCGTTQMEASADKVALVAPGRPPSCVQEAANCSTLITARPGEKIAVTLNTGISISPCDNSNYVQFSDGTAASRTSCQESPPPAHATTTGSEDLFTSTNNTMSVTYRSRRGDNFISIYIQAVGCPHDDLIEGDNIQIQEEAFNKSGYSVNVTCELGYLLSNTSASASATCAFIDSTQIYRWSISSRYQCQDSYWPKPIMEICYGFPYTPIAASVGGAIAILIIIAIVAAVIITKVTRTPRKGQGIIIWKIQTSNVPTLEKVALN